MLSEEEKKAINNLNFIVVTDIYDNEVSINKTEMVNEYNHSVGIVLNLITKLQKENEELKNKNKYLKSENDAYGNTIVKQDVEIKEKDRYIKNSEEITTEMNNDIKKLLLENRQKDKQIDLMAEMIDELSEYYTRYHGKNNEFCKEICLKKDIDCIDCIKQYFETKAKKG